MTTSDVILERLTGLHPKLIDLSLERTLDILDRLGNPQRRLPPVFHVAGTNGKGSVCAYLRAMLEAQGLGVHSYISPHLVRFHERIRLAGYPAAGTKSAPISEPELVALLDECERANEGRQITFFEITTAAAFLAYARHRADSLILEVGLGGDFDSTNVIERPAASIITPIDLDHQEFLGNTLEAIAAVKAGILKRGVPAVIGPQQDAVRAVIEEKAAAIGAPLFMHGQDFMAFEEQGRLVYQDDGGLLDLPLPRLVGRHQIDNAGTAIAALRAAEKFDISDDALERGLREVEWPGRMQRLTRGPLVDRLPEGAELWLDGGHNPAGGRVVAHALADLDQRVARPLVMICGMLSTKDAAGYLANFNGLARHVETVAIPGEKASLSAAALASFAVSAGLSAHAASSVSEALDKALRAASDQTPRVLICGSLYLAGQILRDHQ